MSKPKQPPSSHRTPFGELDSQAIINKDKELYTVSKGIVERISYLYKDYKDKQNNTTTNNLPPPIAAPAAGGNAPLKKKPQ